MKIKAIKKPKRENFKKKAWDAFSKYIRSIGVCQFHLMCELLKIPAPCRCNGVLQASHKISRSKKAILFDERNVFSGCAGSNTWSHFNEADWAVLWRRLWPEDVEYLESQKNKVVKFNNWTYKMIYEDYTKRMS
jgi:hypothetical protein